MMVLLRRLADRGQTIVLVTHATNNIISNCDYVCFLCKDGRLAYFGPPAEAMNFFKQKDFADIYSALEPTEQNKNIPAEAEARFKASSDYQKYVNGPLRSKSTSMLPAISGNAKPKRGDPWKQFFLLSIRYAELLKNDIVTLLILLLQAPVIGLVLVFLIKGLLGDNTFSTSYISTSGINAEKTLVYHGLCCRHVRLYQFSP
jgi:ABC transport system ATP-binding/permease protein